MKRSVLYILAGIAALALCITVCSAGFAPAFEQMPLSMKSSSDAKPYDDEAFMAEAEKVVKKISNSTVPTGSKLSEVTDTYYRLIMDNVSPEFFADANNIVAYIYYTSEAGSTYEDFQEYKNSVSKSTDGSEYYAVADKYREASEEYWSKIKDLFPNMTMYTLPEASADMPVEDESDEGNTLEGLEFNIPISQKESDSASPDQTDKFKTTTIRWFEDYVDRAGGPEDLNPLTNKSEKSPGHRFLTGEGLDWADSTYMDLVSMNVAEDFYNKAQYIDAFFYLITQARDVYEDYINDRTYISSVSYGQENYDKAKKYYIEAEKAISHFNDIIPNETNSTLPNFPDFGEVEMGGEELGELGNVGIDMGAALGFNDAEGNPVE